ncbi:hypothetical protein [Sphaerisporangium sp. NPDC051011]|uniref:hypothetical protein n=1 Tax=Sphaerisporangium sp. NPDC051011 TaxID=3155792 RepID=UPI003410812E
MAADLARPPVCRYVGPRIRLSGGHARLLPVAPVPDGMVAGRFSVLSPGTERRHLAASNGPDGVRDAGYMTIGGDESAGWVLAAVPHGAAFDPSRSGTLAAPPGTSVQVAALARFQQMAVLGLEQLPARVELDGTVVVGSGPVALGCALELCRQGAGRVRVLTSRSQATIRLVPGVECVTAVDQASARLVVDATGRPRRAAMLLASGGTLGLLGTPAPGSVLPSLSLHRSGWTVIGMHELTALATGRYADAYMAAAAWLRWHLDPGLVDAWCLITPGTHAPALYAGLGGPGQPAEPVVIFSWEV